MDKLSVVFRMRISDAEHVALKMVADARGLTPSALLRSLIHDAHRDYQERRMHVARAAMGKAP